MRRRVAVLSAAALAAAAALPAAFAVTGDGAEPATYLVGGDVQSINPTAEMLGNDDFFLGGYGFSSGRPGNAVNVPAASDALGNRFATGILGDQSYGCDPARFSDGTCESDGSHVRAFAVSGGDHTIVMSQIETQGYFDAYKQGPFGINEIRKDASAEIAGLADATLPNGKTPPGKALGLHKPVPSPSEIVVDSDHSHGGADTAGVWGGVPTSYLKLVHDRTVTAIVNAWKAMQPATLSYAAVHGGVNGEAQYPPQECLDNDDAGCTSTPSADWLLNNQFREDPANQTMDDEVRVLQAKDPSTGNVLDTYVSFSAHPTVLGGGNTKVTGDYVGRLDVAIEKTFGGAFAMDQVATLGRTQPTDRGCRNPDVASDDDSQNICALDEYAARVVSKIKAAADRAQPLTGDAVVAMNSYFLNDPTTSPVLAGIVYAGQVIGAPAGRAGNAPWYTGNLLGTSVFAGRIGNILIAGGPGEMYPQIVQKVRDTVNAVTPDKIQGQINIGTAGDFLGYIIAPLEAYTCPAAASFVSGGCNQDTNPDPTRLSPDPIGNDNYFFNISHTFGERLTCDLLRGAGDILTSDKSTYWSAYDRCAAFVNDYALDPDFDMSFPEQPDLSAVMTHM